MGQGMRMALKGATPSACARLKYVTRAGQYAVGRDGPRNDLRATGSGNLPSWACDAEQFWQGVDQFERVNARRCVELELNLPPELNLDQQRQVVEAYAERLLGAERMPHTWAIHDGTGKNPHVHLMFQERGLDGIERPDAKSWFRRASRQPDQGGAKKSRSVKGAAWTMHARATWAEVVNDGLRAAGHEPRFDHRQKAAQLDEALRAGDLRRAALLSTLTERHEGARVSGMRRRVERGEVELADLPDYARDLIQQNDRARVYNCALRDWARTASEVELAEFLAPDLAELRERENPSAHVAAWIAYQHAQALDEDRQRAVAAAQQLGELELRTVAQIEAADLDGLLHGLHLLCEALDELRERDPAATPAVRAALDAVDRLLSLPPSSPILCGHLDALERDYGRLLIESRERHAAAVGYREGEIQQAADNGFDWAAFDKAEAIYDALEPSSLSRSFDDEREEFERYRERHGRLDEEPRWVEFERHGELYGYWDDEPTVIYWYDGREWAETDAVPDPAPAPCRPRLG